MNPKKGLAVGVALGLWGTGIVLGQTSLGTERVASGLSMPLFVTAPPGDVGRIFIVEQRNSGAANRAAIKIMNTYTGAINATPFFTITGVTTGSEQGLLGLAFDPGYDSNGFFYVYYTTTGGGGAAGQQILARYNVSGTNPDLADQGSGLVLLSVPDPQSNHNGGWIGFGPDGFLYVAIGDGGGGNDQGTGHNPTIGNGQDKTTLLGKMLRIDVANAAPPLNYSIPPSNPFFGSATDRQEIWAYGLRNPWRNSFDRETGEFYIADVGQNAWEEINVEPAATGGRNYGWRCYEGNVAFNTANCGPQSGMTFPVHVYSHGSGCSVSGGYVYRGCAIPDLQGTYFFADYCSATIWSFEYAGSPNPPVTNRTAELAPGGGLSIGSITSFGEDARGEVYICDSGSGEVFRIIPEGAAPACALCYADCNNDGALNLSDFGCFTTKFATGTSYSDCNGDAVRNLADFGCFTTKFALGCP